MNKVLTIIIPVYNTEKYLSKCLESLVLTNQPERVEALIVIDGSPDNSIAIARQYEIKYPNVFRVIDKPNGGHGSCCNVGLQEAKGKYLRFLDSDDWFDPCFEQFVDYLSKSDSDVLASKQIDEYIEDNKSIEERFLIPYSYNVVYNIESIDIPSLLLFRFALARSTFKTELLKKFNIRFRERVAYDDVMLQCAGILGVRTIEFLDMPVYHYLLGRVGQTVNPQTLYKKYYDVGIHTVDLMNMYQQHENEMTSLEKKYFTTFIRQRFSIYCNLLIEAHTRREYKSRHKELYLLYKSCENFKKFDDFTYKFKRSIPQRILKIILKIKNN